LGIFTSTIGDLEGVLGELATDLSQTAFDMSLSNEQQTVRAQQLIDNAIRLADEQRKFETDAKNLFLLDIDANDTAVSTERYSQIRWQKELVRIFFSHKYPGSVCTDISNTELRLRMFKAEKQNMLSSLHQLKRRRKIDRNSKQLAALEQYLESEAQTITLEFDATRESGDSNPLFVSATHPFVLMALMDEQSTSTPIYTSLKTTGNDIVPAGNYIFACYECKECGYRESTEIIAVLYDTVKKAPISLPLLKFEQLLLSAQEAGNISAPDLSILDAHIYEQQQAAKNRLLQINQDIVARKLSTLDRYYAKQIEKTQQSLETAKNGRIATMYLSRLHKLQFAWKEKQKSLNRCLCADVLVSLFASGIMEVK
jgi:C4-type Zn-finger protein